MGACIARIALLFHAQVRKAADLDWMAHLLAGLGCPLIVRQPSELRDELRKLAQHAARLAERME